MASPLLTAAQRQEPRVARAYIETVARALGGVPEQALLEQIRQNDLQGALAAADAAWGAAATEWRAQVAGQLRDALEAGAHAVPQLQGRFDVVNPAAVQAARDQAAALVTNVSTETKQAIRRAVVDAVQRGARPAGLVTAIREAVGPTERQAAALGQYRARLEADPSIPATRVDPMVARYRTRLVNQRAQVIARTEVMAAVNEGQRQAWLQAEAAGLVAGMERVWIATDCVDTGDGGQICPCPICDDLDGERAPIDGPFPGDGGMGPPQHPNCRCTTGLVKAKGPALPVAPPPPPPEPAAPLIAPERLAALEAAAPRVPIPEQSGADWPAAPLPLRFRQPRSATAPEPPPLRRVGPSRRVTVPPYAQAAPRTVPRQRAVRAPGMPPPIPRPGVLAARQAAADARAARAAVPPRGQAAAQVSGRFRTPDELAAYQAYGSAEQIALGQGRVIKIKGLGGGITDTYKAELSNGQTVVLKTVESQGAKSMLGEVLGRDIAERVGMADLVPVTTVAQTSKGLATLQAWVPNMTQAYEDQAAWSKISARDLQRARAFDYVMQNGDRHNANWMVAKDGKIALIDNGRLLWGYLRQEMPSPPISQREIPADIIKAWVDAKPAIRDIMTKRGASSSDISGVLGRIDDMARTKQAVTF